MPRINENVFAAILERRQLHLDDAQPIKEVAAEAAGGHFGSQVAIGGGDDMHIDAPRVERDNPADFAQFEHAQELGLRRRWQPADLVEEQRPTIGEFEQARLVLSGAEKPAARVAEQLALKDRVVDR